MSLGAFEEQLPIVSLQLFDDTYAAEYYLIGGEAGFLHYRDNLMYVSSSCAGDMVLDIGCTTFDSVGTPQQKLGSIIIPAGAGDGTVPIVEAFSTLLGSTFPGFVFTYIDCLWVHLQSTPGAAEEVHVTMFGAQL